MTYFESEFSIGETVFVAGTRREQLEGECGFCAGTGDNVGKDGKDRACPECRMRSGVVKLDEWHLEPYIQGPLTVGRIEVMFYGESDDRNYERYMCDETGVGSGTVWGGGIGQTLHRTSEQAHRAARRMCSA